MKRFPRAALVFLAAAGLPLLAGSAARADIPVGYKGLPFDTKVAGGPKLPATVKSGPYAIPGRLDFINYDMGGDGVSYHTGDHITKGGAGYRIDAPTATLSWTGQCIPNVANQVCMNVWYDTSATLDGTTFPSPTTTDFSIGAVQDGDWFDITVNVATSGTYSLSSTWASGNGPPGGEGGNGAMGLAVFSNGTMLATWSAVFPNSNMYADFHHWKAYPNFATVTLTAGTQVIKLQSKAKHLQLDYVQFDLVGADGGTIPTDAGGSGAGGSGGSTGAGGSAGSTGAGGSAGSTGAGGAAGATGAAGTGAAGGTSGGAGVGVTGAAGDTSGTGSAGTTGAAGTGSTTGAAGTGSTTGAAGTGVKGATSSGGGCSCALAASTGAGAAGSFLTLTAMALGLIARARRRRRR